MSQNTPNPYYCKTNKDFPKNNNKANFKKGTAAALDKKQSTKKSDKKIKKIRKELKNVLEKQKKQGLVEVWFGYMQQV